MNTYIETIETIQAIKSIKDHTTLKKHQGL